MVLVREIDIAGPDVDRAVAVARAADPESIWSVQEARHIAAMDARHTVLLAEHEGAAVGAAELGRILAWDEPDGMWLTGWVVPQERRRGAGTALWSGVLARGRRLGLSGLRCSVGEDHPEAIAFLLHRGWREAERDQQVVLRLTEPPTPPAPPPGVTLVTLAHRPDLLAQLEELDAETMPDVPGEEGTVPAIWDADRWGRELDSGAIRPATVVMAVEDGRVVSYTLARHNPGRPEVVTIEYTATRPAARGRGLATLVKRALASAAWAEGVREVRTWNNLDNAPMRAVNERLGYVRGPDVLQMRFQMPRG